MSWSFGNNPVTGTFLGDASNTVHNTFSNTNPGTAFGYLLGYGAQGFGAGGKATGDLYNQLTQKPTVQTPGAAPTLGQANYTAIKGELQNEKNMRGTWGMLTGSGGVLDTPTTNSQRLLGS